MAKKQEPINDPLVDIAVVSTLDIDVDADDYNSYSIRVQVAAGISEWTTVKQSELNELHQALRVLPSREKYIIVRRADADALFIPKTLAEFKEHQRKLQEKYEKERAEIKKREDERKAAAAERKRARELKKLAATKAEREKLFNDLKKEFEQS